MRERNDDYISKKLTSTSLGGFTLAEVLITLAIIGIIAAMTIPALTGSTDSVQTVAGVRKAQAVLSEAMQRYMIDNGCLGDMASCGAFDNGSSSNVTENQAMWDKIKQYFNVSKDCGTAANQGCFPDVAYKRLNNWGVWTNFNASTPQAKATLADGMIMSIYDTTQNCTTDYSTANSGPLYNVCGTVYVDINGQKGPNQEGRDMFTWYITNVGVYPVGALDYTSSDICNPAAALVSGTGWGCTTKVLQEGTVNY